MRNVKALPVYVFKSVFGDSSNGGITSRFNEILVINDSGYVTVDLDNPPDNLCIYVERVLFGEECDYIEPFAKTDDGCVGWMYGGCIADTSDSRFQGRHPVKIHDRQETQAQYDLLSR